MPLLLRRRHSILRRREQRRPADADGHLRPRARPRAPAGRVVAAAFRSAAAPRPLSSMERQRSQERLRTPTSSSSSRLSLMSVLSQQQALELRDATKHASQRATSLQNFHSKRAASLQKALNRGESFPNKRKQARRPLQPLSAGDARRRFGAHHLSPADAGGGRARAAQGRLERDSSPTRETARVTSTRRPDMRRTSRWWRSSPTTWR